MRLTKYTSAGEISTPLGSGNSVFYALMCLCAK